MTTTPRRRFFKKLARMAGGTLVAGTTVAALRAFLRSGPPAGARGARGILRPPGALEEKEFLSLCIRCTRCFDACRPGAIRLFPSSCGELSGTPYIDAEESACNLCLACGEACPAGCLLPLGDKEEARMGTAVVDERLCVSHNGTGVCGACHTICPLKNKAITQDYRNAPEIHPDYCVGCGLCEEACIVEDRKAIQVFTERMWTGS